MTPILLAYLERIRIATERAGHHHRLVVALPWRDGGFLWVFISLDWSRDWDRLEAHAVPVELGESRPIDANDRRGDTLDLTVALAVLGLGRRIPRPSTYHQAWECRNLVEESLRSYGSGHDVEGDAHVVRASIRDRAKEAGFDAMALIDGEALRLVEYASEFEPETYELAFHAAPAVAAACRAFPMLAYDILTSDAVRRDGFDGDVETLLLGGRLDRNLADRDSPLKALAPHVVEWLRGLRIAGAGWNHEAMTFWPDVANECEPHWLPVTEAELGPFLEACVEPQARAADLDLDDEGEAAVIRDYLASVREILDRGNGWKAVLHEWKVRTRISEVLEDYDGSGDHDGEG